MMLAHIEQMPAFQYAKKQLCDTASLLERKGQHSADQSKAAIASGNSYRRVLGHK